MKKQYLTKFFFLLLLLSGCVKEPPPISFGDPLLIKKDNTSIPDSSRKELISEEPVEESPLFLPAPAPPAPVSAAISTTATIPMLPEIEPATVNIHDMPLPAFINEYFGNILHLSFEISSGVEQLRDLVTVRTGEPQNAEGLYDLGVQVLANYGISIQQQGEILRFFPSKESGGDLPFIVSGRALPDVPAGHRPVFFYAPIKVVQYDRVGRWIHTVFKNQLTIEEDSDRNALILIGPPSVIKEAQQMISLLDQPLMRGRFGLRIDPRNLDVEQLSAMLSKVLTAEGYAVTTDPNSYGNIVLLPLKPINTIIAFASSQEAIDHLQQWIVNLDQPATQAEGEGLFFYDVQNTTASRLATTINNLVNGQNSPADQGEKQPPETQEPGHTTPLGVTATVTADELRNSIVFKGNAKEWQRIFKLIKNFDRPSRQVLIEVTIAEITLSDTLNKGVEWGGHGSTSANFSPAAQITAGTLDTLGLLTGGFNFAIDSAGTTKALLNLFAGDNRVNIISQPRILVKSGVEAHIDVGTDVPTISSTQSSASNSYDTANGTGLLQSIEYRKTGVLLGVKPVVFSSNRIDLQVSQEISEISSATTTAIQSPSILSRKIETEITLTDGGSILLGGLISTNRTTTSSGIPLLKDIPYLGQLFRTDSASTTRTMVVMLIVPYIIHDQRQAEEVTEAMKELMRRGSNENIQKANFPTLFPEDKRATEKTTQ